MSLIAHTGRLALVDMSEIEEYPLTRDDRLNSHFFMVWERRRWLNSDMRLKGRAECRALYFDLEGRQSRQDGSGKHGQACPAPAGDGCRFADRDEQERCCGQMDG